MRILRLLFFPALSLLSAFSFFFFLSLTRPYLSLLEKKKSTFLKKKKKKQAAPSSAWARPAATSPPA